MRHTKRDRVSRRRQQDPGADCIFARTRALRQGGAIDRMTTPALMLPGNAALPGPSTSQANGLPKSAPNAHPPEVKKAQDT
jgi:hypothetical protein